MKVAQALAVPIDELLASPRAMVRHWRADEVGTHRKGRGVSIRPLVPEPVPDSMMDVMDFAPGAIMGGTPHLPGTREFFSCIEGRCASPWRATLRVGTARCWPFPATCRTRTRTPMHWRRAASRW